MNDGLLRWCWDHGGDKVALIAVYFYVGICAICVVLKGLSYLIDTPFRRRRKRRESLSRLGALLFDARIPLPEDYATEVTRPPLPHGPDRNQLKFILESTDEIERAITNRFGVLGSLNKIVEEVRNDDSQHYCSLRPHLTDLRYLATIRNKMCHEAGFNEVRDFRGYKAAVERISTALAIGSQDVEDYWSYDYDEDSERLPLSLDANDAADISRMLGVTRRIECILTTRFRGSGVSMGAKLKSAQVPVPSLICDAILHVEGVRNAAVHQSLLDDVEDVIHYGPALLAKLESLDVEQLCHAESRRRTMHRVAVVGAVMVVLIGLVVDAKLLITLARVLLGRD